MEKKKDSFFLPEKKGRPSKADNTKEKPNFKNKQQRQEYLDQNRQIPQKNTEDKKPFDKKAYRLKKYSKKYKLEQWEEQRKKKMLHNYHKEIKNDPVFGSYKPKTFDEDVTDSEQKVGQFVKHPDLMNDQKTKTNKDSFGKAKEHLNKFKQEKLEKQQEKEKIREEKRQKIQEYKKKKQERFKKLSKKTKKGQPVMSGRLELMLEKIQNSK